MARPESGGRSTIRPTTSVDGSELGRSHVILALIRALEFVSAVASRFVQARPNLSAARNELDRRNPSQTVGQSRARIAHCWRDCRQRPAPKFGASSVLRHHGGTTWQFD